MSNHISKKQLREFGLLIGIGFPLVFGLFLPYIHGGEFKVWAILVLILSLFFAIFYPYKLKYLYIYWMKLGHILGFINGKLILGIIHILVVQPLSIILRIFKYDPLEDIDKTLKTYKKQKIKSNINYRKIF
tara:strand:- start:26 stop:418 length:393 start_codon:yes stop_codon:yes gene_type:complete